MKTVSKKLFSLLLVAALLISAVPFQAFATEADSDEVAALNDGEVVHTKHHTMGPWVDNEDGTHSRSCTTPDCPEVETNAHTYTDGVCKTCGRVCPHDNTEMKNGVEPTCTKAGKEEDEVCAECGKIMTKGASIKATGHVDDDNNGKCDVCQENMESTVHDECTLLLDPNGGTINGMTMGQVTVTTNKPVNNLPTPVRPGYKFAGWYMEDGTRIQNGTKYKEAWGDGATATAKWTEITYTLTVRRLLDGKNSTAKTIYVKEVSEGESVLDYLKINVTPVVEAEENATPGYEWKDGYWKDYSGKQPLTSQSDKMDQARTIFVNFVSKSYNLYFVTDFGTVSPSSKTVTYGKAVGTLPTPKADGMVFQGWKDFNGKIWNKDTVYNVEGDSTLTAVWADEALVLLYIYANGNFNAAPIVVVMDGYIKNNNVERSAVESVVKNYYTAANSNGLSIAGLFTEATWASYKKNTSKAGEPNVEVTGEHPMKVYVMVNNAKLGGTGTGGSTTGGSTGSGSSTNPKTGDTAMLGTAATVMVLAAAGFVTMQVRKKKEF